MLVSLHFPRTGGTSFAAALRAQFGDRLLLDYADYPLSETPAARMAHAVRASLTRPADALRNVACVHGHFLPLKYAAGQEGRPAAFVTWLREPVARVCSHYAYWQQHYDRRTSSPLHRRVVEERWSLERFCLSPEFGNLYTQFLCEFPMTRFDFVGFTEHFTDDLVAFARRYGAGAMPAPGRENAGRGPVDPLVRDAGFRRRVAEFHAADVALYALALARRADRR